MKGMVTLTMFSVICSSRSRSTSPLLEDAYATCQPNQPLQRTGKPALFAHLIHKDGMSEEIGELCSVFEEMRLIVFWTGLLHVFTLDLSRHGIHLPIALDQVRVLNKYQQTICGRSPDTALASEISSLNICNSLVCSIVSKHA